MTRRLIAFAIVIACAGSLSAALDEQVEENASNAKSIVEVLASDAYEGRGLGTKGLEKAERYIEERLKALGLKPAFSDSYAQPLDVKVGVSLLDGNELDGVGRDDWTPLGFSSSGTFSGELAFVGYGIEAPPAGYQEMDGLDLNGKVVLMMRYEPQERDDDSVFEGRRPSRWSAVRYKVYKAREMGAAAVVFVTGPLQDEGSDQLPVLRNDGPESPAGIPVLQVKTSVARTWLSHAGLDLEQIQKEIDRDLTPRSRADLDIRVQGTVALDPKYESASNVAAVLPGAGPLANEIVVIGAHYDHLGFGGQGSMQPNEVAIHNGADDNASGTAAVLVAAERMKELLKESANHRTVLFALFTAEEVGLAGSGYLVEHFPYARERIAAMVNLDMVGQLRDDHLSALGAESASEWKPILEKLASELGLDASAGGDGYGPSDQTSFYAEGIPVLHFFTGAHELYHTPGDDADTLNYEGIGRIAELTALLGDELARLEKAPVYARASSAPAMEGDSRGYGAYLGTIPDYSAMEDTSGGVLLSDVRKGGPADLAGIRGGDRIIGMAGRGIENLYDMTFALQDNKPGETIDVVIQRNGEEMTLRATLGDRKRMSQAPAASPQGSPENDAQPNPHAGAAPAPEKAQESFELPEFYRNRPGADFEVGAGKPFEKRMPDEKHFGPIRQLTFGGENAEAYFSPDGTELIYQVTTADYGCDQQYILDLATGESRLVSSGEGRTTCGYFDYPEGDRIIWASTVSAGKECPETPDMSRGYVWPVYATFELWSARPDGSDPQRLTNNDFYDAEATWCHRGGWFVFTSDRDGDLDLYVSDEAGRVTRMTDTPGYDGGAFFSPDCKEIVWRASRPEGKALEEYRALLADHLVRPSRMEIYVMDADGTNVRQVTNNGAANFCPYFHPDGRRIIYASNAGEDPREFDLFLVDKNGGEPERITFTPGFDGFPMFSPDGEWIVWASNRANPKGRETNLYIAKWIE